VTIALALAAFKPLTFINSLTVALFKSTLSAEAVVVAVVVVVVVSAAACEGVAVDVSVVAGVLEVDVVVSVPVVPVPVIASSAKTTVARLIAATATINLRYKDISSTPLI
jgi:hypothetical protein